MIIPLNVHKIRSFYFLFSINMNECNVETYTDNSISLNIQLCLLQMSTTETLLTIIGKVEEANLTAQKLDQLTQGKPSSSDSFIGSPLSPFSPLWNPLFHFFKIPIKGEYNNSKKHMPLALFFFSF